MPKLDFDALWDYDHPDQTEAAFRRLLLQAEQTHDRSYYLQLLTQIARAQALQRQFEEAHQTLDRMKEGLSSEMVTPTIRYLLERGRVFNSSGQASEAQTWFQQALELARRHEEEAFFAVDAAHMLAIAAPSAEEQITWNLTALQMAEASPDEQARGWCGSLYNNLGWTYHDRGEFERALEYFQKTLHWQEEHGTTRWMRVARWCVGRTLRSMQRTTEALALQEELLAEWEKSGEEQDGYVFEEIAECLLVLERASEGRPYFAQAYALLSQDRWLVAQEKERLDRLKRLGEEMLMSKQPVTYYAVTRERGDNWDDSRGLREQEQWDEHARFMDALAEDGFIVLGGPLDHGERFLLIVNAESRQAIEARLADDPWTPMGLLRIAKVERWEILLGAPARAQ